MEKEILHLLQYMPFVAMTNGKVKPNYARIGEMALFACIVAIILWNKMTVVESGIVDIKKQQESVFLEFREHKARTEERLGTLERELIDIKGVVYRRK